uniref:Predicted protein n=1 Tax=Hordeum vulgare subsp. vulgare TaxID=112509 RepID=F2CT89_HORVV|nr:predicted protein [Hordeum vulgare subsp. vulgare]
MCSVGSNFVGCIAVTTICPVSSSFGFLALFVFGPSPTKSALSPNLGAVSVQVPLSVAVSGLVSLPPCVPGLHCSREIQASAVLYTSKGLPKRDGRGTNNDAWRGPDGSWRGRRHVEGARRCLEGATTRGGGPAARGGG